MSADKRTPHTDALETLGMIHQHDEKRDAIHLAVIPAIAGEPISPGAHIQYVEGTAYNCEEGQGQGIADPFLTGLVEPGERFWFVVYPRAIRSLRHVWEHPAFPSSISEEMDEQVIISNGGSDTTELTDAQIAEAKAMLGDPQELGKRIVAEIARDFDVTPEWLMDQTDQSQADPWHYAIHPNDGGKFEGESLPERFWDAYADAKGVDRSSIRRENFLSCSC